MKKSIKMLTSHPAHSGIYETPEKIREMWSDLVTSMDEFGMQQPILVTKENVIVSGHRRWMVAKELGWESIDVQEVNVTEKDFQSMLVQLNTNRVKTEAEKINEALYLLSVTPKRQGKKNLPEEEKGDRHERIAKKLGRGFSKSNIDKIEKIKQADDSGFQCGTSLIEMLKSGVAIDHVYQLMQGDKKKLDDVKEIIECEMGTYKLINGDSKKELLTNISEGSVDMCFTSYPYFQQRQYEILKDKDNSTPNWGEEENVEEFLKNCVEVAQGVYKTLKETGSFYLNITDTIRNRECMLIPENVCLKLKGIGFHLVNKLVWKKLNSKPQNLDKQLQPSYEMVFHFVKDVTKFKNRILRFNTGKKLTVKSSGGDRTENGIKKAKKKRVVSPYSRFRNFYDEQDGYTDIIKSAVAQTKEVKKITGIDHCALMTETLPLFAILQSTEIGDVVMDCCSGNGTVGVCTLFGRKYLGVEISKLYHSGAVKRLEYYKSAFDKEEMNEFESYAMAA
jgi:DNA modification methylase